LIDKRADGRSQQEPMVDLNIEKDKSLHTQFLFAATGCC
jgi:hypothetical protein